MTRLMDQQPGWRVVWPTGTEGRWWRGIWTVDDRDRTAGGWMEAAATTWSTNTSTMFQRWDVYLGFGHFATDSSSRLHLWYLVLNVIYNLNTLIRAKTTWRSTRRLTESEQRRRRWRTRARAWKSSRPQPTLSSPSRCRPQSMKEIILADEFRQW